MQIRQKPPHLQVIVDSLQFHDLGSLGRDRPGTRPSTGWGRSDPWTAQIDQLTRPEGEGEGGDMINWFGKQIKGSVRFYKYDGRKRDDGKYD